MLDSAPCTCTLHYDVDSCIQAHRIDHHVPIFRFSTEFSYGMPAHLSPRGGDDNGAEHVESCAEDMQSSKKEPDIEGEDDDWVDDLPPGHLLTHLPKSRSCETCLKCKLCKYPSRRIENQREMLRNARKVEEPKEFLERISVGHIEARDSVGFRKEQYSLCMIDRFSGLVGLHVSETKSADDVEEGLRKFCGRLRPGIVSVASDRAPAILAAIKNLGFISELSEPTSSHSGIPREYWPVVHVYIEYAMNITEGPKGPHAPKTAFEVAHGYPYEGVVAPFGCLMWYKEINPITFDPKGKPGLFLGAEIIAGVKFKGIYKIWPLSAVSEGVFKSVATRSLAIPPGKWRFFLKGVDREVVELHPKSIHSCFPPEKRIR